MKEADLEAKEKLLQMRSASDKKSQQRRDEIKSVEKRLQQKEEGLDKKTQQIDTRITEVEKRDRALTTARSASKRRKPSSTSSSRPSATASNRSPASPPRKRNAS